MRRPSWIIHLGSDPKDKCLSKGHQRDLRQTEERRMQAAQEEKRDHGGVCRGVQGCGGVCRAGRPPHNGTPGVPSGVGLCRPVIKGLGLLELRYNTVMCSEPPSLWKAVTPIAAPGNEHRFWLKSSCCCNKWLATRSDFRIVGKIGETRFKKRLENLEETIGRNGC